MTIYKPDAMNDMNMQRVVRTHLQANQIFLDPRLIANAIIILQKLQLVFRCSQ